MTHARRSRALGLAAAMLFVTVAATACAKSGTAITTPFVGQSVHWEHGPTYEVKVANVSGLGPILVDGRGQTLYLFVPDHQGQPSTCYGICAVEWPPQLLPTGLTRPVAGPGVETQLLGSSVRKDGTTQITYNGWPLYYWPHDLAPGQATGQGINNAGGLWYVLDAAGNAVHTR